MQRTKQPPSRVPSSTQKRRKASAITTSALQQFNDVLVCRTRRMRQERRNRSVQLSLCAARASCSVGVARHKSNHHVYN